MSGFLYSQDYSAKGLISDRWIPDIAAVRRVINDSSGNYIKNDNGVSIQTGGFKLGTGSKIQVDTLKIGYTSTGLSTDSVLVKGTDGVVRKVAQSSISAAATLQTVTTAGNTTTNSVTIGSASAPSYGLDVRGTFGVSNSTTTGTGKTYGVNSSFLQTGIGMTNYDSVMYAQFIASTTNGAVMQVRDLNDNDTATVVALSPSNTRFLIANIEKARITSAGLGIGTTSPAYTLDVNGDAHIFNRVKLDSIPTGNNGDSVLVIRTATRFISKVAATTYQSPLTFSNGVVNTGGVVTNTFYTGDGATQTLNGANTSGGSLIFSSTSHATKGNQYFGAAQTSVFSESTGNWGLGTTSLEQRLNVAGNIISIGNIYSKGTQWTAQTVPAANDWRRICYGNGLFVAVAGAAGSGTQRVMTSPDGINWTLRTTSNQSWNGVCYGNGLFVAVASSGTGNRVMTSVDGITWTLGVSAADNTWSQVEYGNGLFVAVCNGSANVMTSPDGITWTSRSVPEANNWQGLIYGNGLWVATAISGTNRVMTSPDGITWTARTATSASSWLDVSYGNGLFVAVALDGGTSSIMTSPDGITWTARTTTSRTWWSISYGNGVFVCTAQSGGSPNIMTSPDGIIWTTRSTPASAAWLSSAYGNGVFVATSTNGSTSTSVMTSGFSDYIPNNHNNNIYQGGMTINGRTNINGGVAINKDSVTIISAIGSNSVLLQDTTTNKVQRISPLNLKIPIAGSFSQVGAATTVFTVTIGTTMANTTYKVNVTPTAALSAALFYVTNKTTTTFDVTYIAGLTGTVTFDYSVFP